METIILIAFIAGFVCYVTWAILRRIKNDGGSIITGSNGGGTNKVEKNQ